MPEYKIYHFKAIEASHLRRTFKSNIGVIKRITKEIVAKRRGTLEDFNCSNVMKIPSREKGFFAYGVGVALAGAEVDVAAAGPLVFWSPQIRLPQRSQHEDFITEELSNTPNQIH